METSVASVATALCCIEATEPKFAYMVAATAVLIIFWIQKEYVTGTAHDASHLRVAPQPFVFGSFLVLKPRTVWVTSVSAVFTAAIKTGR